MVIVSGIIVILLLVGAVGALIGVAYVRRYRAEAARPKAEAFAEEDRLRQENGRRPGGP